MKRFRAARACDSCRHRKTRCDARDPCGPCVSLNQMCRYGTEATSRGKSEMILDTVLRMEASIDELKGMVAMGSGSNVTSDIQADATSSRSTITPMAQDAHRHPGGRTIKDPTESAVLSSGHLSSAESLLKWSVFRDHPSILEEAQTSFLSLEYGRSSFPSKLYGIVPSAGLSDVKNMVGVFQRTYNFWFPTICFDELKSLQLRIWQEHLEPSCQSCLALLVMALGCVGASVIDEEDSSESKSQQLKLHGESWFTAAMKMLHLAHIEMNVEACQCLFLTGLYFSFLQRPLQTWSYVNSAANRSRFLLSCPLDNPERDDREHITRIFWSCFVLESNYISELPSLPHNCNTEIESVFALPGKFHSHEAIEEEEKSTFYFLASIALRRLLNRAHYMLYDRDNGLQIDSNNFYSVNQELTRQLHDWYQTLPPSLRFPQDDKPADDPHSEYLRQWYLSCRSVIYRPYLEWALANPLWDLNSNLHVLDGCRVVLDTCLFKLRHLKQVPYDVMVNAWPCSLSLETAILTLMGGFCHPQLTMQLRHISLLDIGPRLEQHLQRWMTIHGSSVSPSIEKALRLIMKAHEFFESKSADFAPAREERQHRSPVSLRMPLG